MNEWINIPTNWKFLLIFRSEKTKLMAPTIISLTLQLWRYPYISLCLGKCKKFQIQNFVPKTSEESNVKRVLNRRNTDGFPPLTYFTTLNTGSGNVSQKSIHLFFILTLTFITVIECKEISLKENIFSVINSKLFLVIENKFLSFCF